MIKKIIIYIYLWILKILNFKFIHFIHIGKTAGSAIRNSFAMRANFSKRFLTIDGKIFIMHGHNFKLSNLSTNEHCFFVVRDPISRFISSFYSRLREGKPKNFNPWKKDEIKAFQIFKSPNQLGEALSSDDYKYRLEAERAMQGIGHVKSSYWDWFESEEYLLKNKSKIRKVLIQENLSEDYSKFAREENLKTKLPGDGVSKHKTPDHFDKKLSDLAINNLKKWYSRDYKFLELLYKINLISKQYD